MRIHFHLPGRLFETVGGFCAGLIVVAMLAFALAEMLVPIVRLIRP